MKIALIAGAVLLVSGAAALAQSMDHMPGMDHAAMASRELTQPGESAFGAIQEIVEKLEADPNTDWSRVHIDALREHLIDMDEVTLHATIQGQPMDGGMRYTVSGTGRTLEAIQRMVVGHAQAMGDAAHWTMTAQRTPTGAVVTVMVKQPSDLPRIRALGLIGMMSDGAHHQVHHWYLATGEGPMTGH